MSEVFDHCIVKERVGEQMSLWKAMSVPWRVEKAKRRTVVAGDEMKSSDYAGYPKVRAVNVPLHHEVPRGLYPGDVDWGYVGVPRPSGAKWVN